jgi:hypothetical protein
MRRAKTGSERCARDGRAPPRLLHVVNVLGGLALWALILLAALEPGNKWKTALLLSGAGIYFAVYARFRARPQLASFYFSIAVALGMYAILAESLFALESILGSSLSRSLDLSLRLRKEANARVTGDARRDTFEQYGDDPLFYRRVPGSKHRARYEGRGAWYEVAVDETGYLNLDRGAYLAAATLDLFLAGDSVLQGVGGPSCVEHLKERLSATVWNLSTGSYGPRQKSEALRRFALPKRPKWIVLEFYAGNDASEANEDEILAANGIAYEGRFAIKDMQSLFAASERYAPIVCGRRLGRLERLRRDNLTLALTTRLLHRETAVSCPRSPPELEGPSSRGSEIRRVAAPAYSHFEIYDDRYLAWIRRGLDSTGQSYRALLAAVGREEAPPRVLLMYNPSSYEIYRSEELRSEAWNQRAQLQRGTLRAFAADNDIAFLDLTPAFASRVADGEVSLYGREDSIHWSPEGTGLAAEIVLQALRTAGVGIR